MPTDELLRWSSHGVRVRAWRDQRHIAHLTPVRRPGSLRRRDVDEVLDGLVSDRVTGALTSALGPYEERVFREAGFDVHERLLLLRHDLTDVGGSGDNELRRAGRRDRAAVLDVDRSAFRDFWQLDDAGLSDAIRATPHARFRVAVDDDEVVGYAVTGRAGNAGFLQRLAVRPDQQGKAIGRSLVNGGLAWLRRRRAHHVLVNTQHDNSRAIDLYERLGFRREPHDLAVLRWGEAP